MMSRPLVVFSLLFALLLGFLIATPADAQTTITEYNDSLILNGYAWKSGGAPYYPSFYTGFAPRIEDANRIHFRLSRGNQIRLTAPLDEMAVLTYLYGLKKRDLVYTSMIDTKVIVPLNKRLVDSYRSIIASPVYEISATLASHASGQLSREQLYEKSLATLKALNPGRVFDVRIDLRKAAQEWRDGSLRTLATRAASGDVKAFLKKYPKESVVAMNALLFGRINATLLSDSQYTQLAALVSMSQQAPVSADEFTAKTLELLKSVTNDRYEFRVLEGGRFRPAIECQPQGSCDLVYSELTAIYPNGSVRSSVSDRDGNRIPMIRENGVLHFVERASHDVDHIRTEPYYGYMPKMDYTATGNGIHNPAVRTYLPSSKYKGLREKLSIPKTDNMLWIVSRGLVSHGCTRMAAGHLEEVRQIFPSNPDEMTKVLYTGNASTDYDLFDIDADGQLEVMGVDYLIAYAIVSDSGEGYREGNGLTTSSFKRDEFYAELYGKNQFVNENGRYVFRNPYVSAFTGDARKERAKAFSVRMTGDFPLYEQAYEKDKIQFFSMPRYSVDSLQSNSNNKTNKGVQVVRLLGRINACGPFATEFTRCFETGFDNEMKSLVK